MKTFKVFFAVVISLFLFNLSLSAQSQAGKFSEVGIKELTRGIESSNTGLKTSAIYLAGKYRIEELLPVLKNALYKEQNVDVKKNILLTLGQFQGNKVNNIFTDFIKSNPEQKLKEQAMTYIIYFQSDALVNSDK